MSAFTPTTPFGSHDAISAYVSKASVAGEARDTSLAPELFASLDATL